MICAKLTFRSWRQLPCSYKRASEAFEGLTYLCIFFRDTFFPEWTTIECPPRYWALTQYPDGVKIRFPTMLPFQVLGTAIGLHSMWRICIDLIPQSKDQEEHWAWSPHWNWSYLFFMIMNVVSILVHNLFPPYTRIWDIAWRLDTLATGLCAINLAIVGWAMIMEYVRSDDHVDIDERRNSGQEEVLPNL